MGCIHSSNERGVLADKPMVDRLLAQTPMSYQWIADRLRMGSGSYVFNLMASVKSEL